MKRVVIDLQLMVMGYITAGWQQFLESWKTRGFGGGGRTVPYISVHYQSSSCILCLTHAVSFRELYLPTRWIEKINSTVTFHRLALDIVNCIVLPHPVRQDNALPATKEERLQLQIRGLGMYLQGKTRQGRRDG